MVSVSAVSLQVLGIALQLTLLRLLGIRLRQVFELPVTVSHILMCIVFPAEMHPEAQVFVDMAVPTQA